MKRLILAAAALLGALCACTPDDPMVVKTGAGLVRGVEQDGTMAFLGIPYAKVERFMPPLPVDKWDTVMVCDHMGPQVMQGNGRRTVPESEMSEKNSCVLNVWTTDTKGCKPVMLWIHGGGFDSGSAAGNPGMALAQEDVVVVSLNHRLNILGFLDLSTFGEKYAHSGMVGMLDIVQCLEWIRDNIRNFGGDPDCVTIGGQSGGGGKTSTLMAQPAAEGLFHRAIVQSGSTLRQSEPEQSRALGLEVLKELGLTPETADKLAEVPYGELVAAGNRASRTTGGRFAPVVDGKYLVQHPFDPVAPECSRDVPMLIGSNYNEFCYTNNIKYTVDERARQNVLSQASVKAAQGGAPAYVYLFKWESGLNDGALAACHGMELPFMFNNVALQREMTGGTKAAYKMADKVSSAWIQFIRTGDPNVKCLPEWKPFSAETQATMALDNECGLETIVH